jgi:hypothetical protein
MRAAIQPTTKAVRGGVIAGMDTSVLPSIPHGQFTEGRRAG